MLFRRLFVLSIAAAAVYSDLHTWKISNILVAIGYGAGLVLTIAGCAFVFPASIIGVDVVSSFARSVWVNAFLSFLGGAALPILIGLPLYHFRMFGAGDIKLLSAIGSIMGVYVVLPFLCVSVLCAGIIALLLQLRDGTGFQAACRHLYDYAVEVVRTGKAVPYMDKALIKFHYSVPVLMASIIYAGGLM